MSTMRITVPDTDPVSIFELFNAGFGSKLLTAATVHLNVFGLLASGPLPAERMRSELGVSERAFQVLMTGLRAFDLVELNDEGCYLPTALARTHLTPEGLFDVTDYLELAADARGVKDLVDRLRTSRPAGDTPEGRGAAYIYREGVKSAMQDERQARWLTERLAGRAINTAAALAKVVPLQGAKHLVDIGGGTGVFSIAYVQQNPQLRATIVELPEVSKVARDYAERFGVADRVACVDSDMFTDPFPAGADAILLSNVLHDWDVPECRALVNKCALSLKSGGQLIVHDAFLDDALDGPFHLAIYSVILFYLTEGRAYSAAECRQWLLEADLVPESVKPTCVHCSALTASKPN